MSMIRSARVTSFSLTRGERGGEKAIKKKKKTRRKRARAKATTITATRMVYEEEDGQLLLQDRQFSIVRLTMSKQLVIVTMR